jgi:signal transduction histidine kinase
MSPIGQKTLDIDDVGQILGKRWTDFWRQEDQPRVNAALVAARTGQVGCFHGILPTKNGPTSWDVRVSPVLGDDGEVERLIAISRDITELERSQPVAVQAEKLAAAGRLAATIAHEINNPLEAVTNLIYLAKSWEGVPAEVCKQLEIADRELARVPQLAQQTLGFYRDNMSSKWVPVAELVGDVLLIYERKLKYRHLEALVSVDPDLKIFGKQGELKQAVSNLMANAIEASKIGGKVWLSARTTRTERGNSHEFFCPGSTRIC